MRITLISGADGATFAHALATSLSPDDELTVIAPTVRGHFSAGLQASPDLDALLNQAGPKTFSVAEAVDALGYLPAWQRASDRVTATRIVRTDLLANGASLTDATIAAASRAGVPFTLLPVCDQRAEFRVVLGTDKPTAVHIDEYLADPSIGEATQLLLVADQIAASAAVTSALEASDVLILGPSSRTLAIDPVLRTPGLLDAVRSDLPVLVVQHQDQTPADLITAAGLGEADPGSAQPVGSDPGAVLDLARKVNA